MSSNHPHHPRVAIDQKPLKAFHKCVSDITKFLPLAANMKPPHSTQKIHSEIVQRSKQQRCGDGSAKKHQRIKNVTSVVRAAGIELWQRFSFSAEEDLNLLVRIEAHF